jgi:hypothetical protein
MNTIKNKLIAVGKNISLIRDIRGKKNHGR